jgi:hypothetical protein
MVLIARVWFIDSPEHGEDIAKRFFKYGPLRKLTITRTTTIDVIKKAFPLETFAGSCE